MKMSLMTNRILLITNYGITSRSINSKTVLVLGFELWALDIKNGKHKKYHLRFRRCDHGHRREANPKGFFEIGNKKY